MPRDITLDHIRVKGFQLERNKAGDYLVEVQYAIEDSGNTTLFSKSIKRFNSTHTSLPKLPSGWETDFDSLISAITTAVTTLENL